MKIKFQADSDLNEDILNGVIRRVPEIDFRTASDASLDGLDDPKVLAFAASEGRILVTHDRRTMPHHFAEFIAVETCPGLIVISQKAPVGTIIDDLILIWHVSEPSEFLNSVRTLPL